jgi:hypothetical protein
VNVTVMRKGKPPWADEQCLYISTPFWTSTERYTYVATTSRVRIAWMAILWLVQLPNHGFV